MWQQNADAWASRLLPAFPLYADLLQPDALAVYEMRAGFSMLTHVHTALQQVGPSLELGAVLAQLMAFPATNTRAGGAHVPLTLFVSRSSKQGTHLLDGLSGTGFCNGMAENIVCLLVQELCCCAALRLCPSQQPRPGTAVTASLPQVWRWPCTLPG